MECQTRLKRPAERQDDVITRPRTGEELPPLDLEGVPTTSRSTLSSKSGLSEERSHEDLRDSHKRLKKKTRVLLKQYRRGEYLAENVQENMRSEQITFFIHFLLEEPIFC